MVTREKTLHQSDPAHGGKFSLHQFNNRIEQSAANNSIQYPPKCYYCDVNGFTTQDQYERHVVNYHEKLPCYPGPADLESLGLASQGMPWEQQLPRDQYFTFELWPKR